jgi:hypothetical protein
VTFFSQEKGVVVSTVLTEMSSLKNMDCYIEKNLEPIAGHPFLGYFLASLSFLRLNFARPRILLTKLCRVNMHMVWLVLMFKVNAKERLDYVHRTFCRMIRTNAIGNVELEQSAVGQKNSESAFRPIFHSKSIFSIKYYRIYSKVWSCSYCLQCRKLRT